MGSEVVIIGATQMGYYGSTLLDAGDSKRRFHQQEAASAEYTYYKKRHSMAPARGQPA